MTNREMAAMLFNIATLLRDREDNPYRIRAYENGARALMSRRQNDWAAPLAASDKTLPHRKGLLGERLQRKLKELVQTGEMRYFNDLCAELPSHLGALMQVPGIGPRTAQRLHDTLGISTPEELFHAAQTGQLQRVWGIGTKRESEISYASAQLSLFDEAA